MNIQRTNGDVLFYLAKSFLNEEDGLGLALSRANIEFTRLFANYRFFILYHFLISMYLFLNIPFFIKGVKSFPSASATF